MTDLLRIKEEELAELKGVINNKNRSGNSTSAEIERWKDEQQKLIQQFDDEKEILFKLKDEKESLEGQLEHIADKVREGKSQLFVLERKDNDARLKYRDNERDIRESVEDILSMDKELNRRQHGLEELQ